VVKRKTNPKQSASSADIESIIERQAHGKSYRNFVARADQAKWEPHSSRRDPLEILEESNKSRIQELVPIRYGRMLKSPFTFFRGSAAVMAADLATTPTTGIYVQACGDCHLLNFGAYATPERNMVCDINDFDETLPAPWEWDVKRLATSFVLACRSRGFDPDVAFAASETVARSYREAMREFAEMPVLDVWYSKMDRDRFLRGIKDKTFRQEALAYAQKQKQKASTECLIPKFTVSENGHLRFKDVPPLVYHSEEQKSKEFHRIAQETFAAYKETLSEERRVLVDRFHLVDVAKKVVGIGSVGTYCGIMLLVASGTDRLILQIKEARESVLEPYAGHSLHKTHGQRVVVGQRLMQAHSDIFLGWTAGTGKYQRSFYVRQLNDMKISLVPEVWTEERAVEVAESLGWVLARAHARSGDPAMISGYLGTKDTFEDAIAKFALAYADQTERDHKTLVAAVRSGKIEAIIER
jgi:uncharacterized protein (DUF2252 family)